MCVCVLCVCAPPQLTHRPLVHTHTPPPHPKGGLAPLTLVDDDLLEVLAVEIPDLRTRVGVRCVCVWGGGWVDVGLLQLQVEALTGRERPTAPIN